MKALKSDQDAIIQKFLEICRRHVGGEAHYTRSKEIDDVINNIIDYPHMFVLACLMDRQIKAERAWEIPYLVCRDLCDGDFSFSALLKLTQEQVVTYFNLKSLHRFNDKMADVFCKAISKISNDYDNDASRIWRGENSSAEVICRFLGFEGCGIKIASMATNLLHRNFRVQYSDYSALDISPDIHTRRVLYRLGFIDNKEDINLVIYRAKSICPQYPGLLDECCWDVGRKYCHNMNPKCGECELNEVCATYRRKNDDKRKMKNIQ